MLHKNLRGFTLLEILIALFIFTILSMLMVSALHQVINISGHTEEKAKAFRNLQFILLVMSRDIEEAVYRPVLNINGREEPALVGGNNTLTFTRTGVAHTVGVDAKSILQRVRYDMRDGMLYRSTWQVLDAAPSTLPTLHPLARITVNFEYLDKAGKWHNTWPIEGKKEEALPRAVYVHLDIPNLGKMSQIYLINAEMSKAVYAPPSNA